MESAVMRLKTYVDLCTTARFLMQCRKWRWGEAMARRDFRQLGLADSIVRRRGKKSEWLDRLDAALEWPALERIVAGVYASREGGLAYPLLTYVKLLLLQQFHDILPGTSIAWVHREAEERYAEVAEQLEALIATSLAQIAGEGGQPLVFNAAPYAVEGAAALGAGAAAETEAGAEAGDDRETR